MDKEIEEAFKLFTDFKKNRKKVLQLLNRKCQKSVVLSGIIGQYTGINEIFRAISIQNQTLPFTSIKIFKKTSFENILQYHGLFSMVHKGQLQANFKLFHPESSNNTLIHLFTKTPPQGAKVEIHLEMTTVLEDQKIAFINLNADPLEIIRQVAPQQIEEEHYQPEVLTRDHILSIQSKFQDPPTLMEIQCLAFSLCGFSSKQTASHLLLSHRTIETYLQNAYLKIGCKNKLECLETMYSNALIHHFQQLCHQLIQYPRSIIRS